jgi:plastocyanin
MRFAFVPQDRRQGIAKYSFISLGLISYATAQTTNENNVIIPVGASMKPENGFEPKTINVKAGQIVTWKNMDNSLHTVISGTGLNDPNNGKAFDSGLTSLIPGKSWSHQFIIAGTFPYFCELHPAMTGLVVLFLDARSVELFIRLIYFRKSPMVNIKV